ncbi:MAG: hypothetical protein ACYTBJ_20710 [Planctomycetota bacterium]|jgi:hypothetical protein
MKNKDILLLDQELPTVNPPEMDGWFNYAVQETIQMAASKAKSIRDVIAPKEEMTKYQEALKKLQEKHAEKDEYGEPMKIVTELGGGRRLEKFIIADIDDPKCAFNKAAERLSKKYKTAIDEYNKKLDFLDEENPTFEPFWIDPKKIPNGLSRDQMAAVILMVKKKEPKA